MLVGSVFLVLPGALQIFPHAFSPADGISPGSGEIWIGKGGGTAALRRLALRRPSANGRQEQENTPVLC